ncbi:MAG: hypothetical protein H6R26_199 [Proteobacteria bacterium]|nr:hypothetical protein [Pseudomonadota bacterium]
MKTDRFFAILALTCLGNAVAAVESVAARGDEQSLAGLLGEYRARSGVDILLAPTLGGDLIARRAGDPLWPGGVDKLLAGYNYEVVQGTDGHISRIIVSGRSHDAAPPEQQRSAVDATMGELLNYKPKPPAIPDKYAAFVTGSVSAVSLPTDRLTAMKPGERLVLSLPVGQYEVEHDNLFRHENGDVTWVGFLAGAGKGYRVIVTIGREGSLGQIVTPDGLYNIDLEEGQNWLVDVTNSGLQAGSLEHDEIEGSLASVADQSVAELPASAEGKADVLEAKKKKANKRRAARKKAAASSKVKGGRSGADTVIDLMIVYTRGMNAKPLKTRLNFLVASANQAYLDSGIRLKLRLVASVYSGYTEANDNAAALMDLSSGKGAFGSLNGLRRRYGADLVSLIRPFRYATQKSCGVAWVNGARGGSLHFAMGYSVVSDGRDPTGWYCTDYTLAHELGHNMGSVHDMAHSAFQGKYPFSYGYGAAGKFGTIMSYFNPVVGVFSSPRLICLGGPCGTASDADNSRSIGLTAPVVSGFMPTKK